MPSGVTFHNGDPFTADDVICTYERSKNPDNSIHSRVVDNILEQHHGVEFAQAEAALHAFQDAPIEEKDRILKEFKRLGEASIITNEERKQLRKALRRQLVKRDTLMKIVFAWIITVPISAFMSALFYFMLRGMLLP